MIDNAGQTTNVEREPKWIAETQVIQNQITEARELCRKVGGQVDCLLVLEPPKENLPENGARVEEAYTVADHRNVDTSPLTLRLHDLQRLLSELSHELSELLGRINA